MYEVVIINPKSSGTGRPSPLPMHIDGTSNGKTMRQSEKETECYESALGMSGGDADSAVSIATGTFGV